MGTETSPPLQVRDSYGQVVGEMAEGASATQNLTIYAESVVVDGDRHPLQAIQTNESVWKVDTGITDCFFTREALGKLHEYEAQRENSLLTIVIKGHSGSGKSFLAKEFAKGLREKANINGYYFEKVSNRQALRDQLLLCAKHFKIKKDPLSILAQTNGYRELMEEIVRSATRQGFVFILDDVISLDEIVDILCYDPRANGIQIMITHSGCSDRPESRDFRIIDLENGFEGEDEAVRFFEHCCGGRSPNGMPILKKMMKNSLGYLPGILSRIAKYTKHKPLLEFEKEYQKALKSMDCGKANLYASIIPLIEMIQENLSRELLFFVSCMHHTKISYDLLKLISLNVFREEDPSTALEELEKLGLLWASKSGEHEYETIPLAQESVRVVYKKLHPEQSIHLKDLLLNNIRRLNLPRGEFRELKYLVHWQKFSELLDQEGESRCLESMLLKVQISAIFHYHLKDLKYFEDACDDILIWCKHFSSPPDSIAFKHILGRANAGKARLRMMNKQYDDQTENYLNADIQEAYECYQSTKDVFDLLCWVRGQLEFVKYSMERYGYSEQIENSLLELVSLQDLENHPSNLDVQQIKYFRYQIYAKVLFGKYNKEKKEGDLERSIHYLNAALAQSITLFGHSHHDQCSIYNMLGCCERARNEFIKAKDWFGKSLEIDLPAAALDHIESCIEIARTIVYRMPLTEELIVEAREAFDKTRLLVEKHFFEKDGKYIQFIKQMEEELNKKITLEGIPR